MALERFGINSIRFRTACLTSSTSDVFISDCGTIGVAEASAVGAGVAEASTVGEAVAEGSGVAFGVLSGIGGKKSAGVETGAGVAVGAGSEGTTTPR